MAMILPGTIQDSDFNFVGYQALQDINKKYGIEVKYQEQVAPADAERVARGFITDGYTIIAFHGGQFLTTAQKLAPQFPDVSFIIETSGKVEGLPNNSWVLGRKFYQGFYALGTLGALSTKSGKIGVIAGVKLPDFVSSINAIKMAAKEAKPDVKVVYTFVGDQNDPVKARQAAESMVGEGVDFIIMIVNLGAYGVIEAVKDKPVLITTYYTDKTNLAPKNFATSLLTDFSTPYLKIVDNILKGTRGGYEEMRPGNGFSLGKITNVPDDVAKKVQAVFEEVAKGSKSIPEISDEVKD
jgi:basic membrane protein A